MSLDTGAASDYAALRARLGFALVPEARVRRALVRPAPRKPVEPPKATPEAVPGPGLVDRYGWPLYVPAVFYDAYYDVHELPRKTLRQIIREVCVKHGVSELDLQSYRRDAPVVRARHEAFFRARYETKFSLAEIGRRIGNRDHTTVIHGIWAHRQRMKRP